jgi:hypothetical protein
MQTTPIDRKQRSRHRTTGHCLQTIQAKTSETQNISMEKSRYLQDKGRSRISDRSIKSKVLSFLVGKSTICSKPLSATISRNVWLVLIGYCLFMMKIYLWKKADIYKIKEDLESFGNIGKRDIESLWHALKDAIQNTIDFKECLVGFDWILSIYDGLFFPVDIG